MGGITLPANLNVYFSAAVFFIGAYAMAIYLGLIVWTYHDIRSRTRDVLAQILAVFLVVLFNVFGVIPYLLVRPKEKLSEAYERALAEEAVLQELEERRTCPSCQRRVEADFILCPYCRHQLRLRCTQCGRLLDLAWEFCPYCGHYHTTSDEKEETLATEQALTQEIARVSSGEQG